jgi:thiazole synthase ThiGH ThiG subunit
VAISPYEGAALPKTAEISGRAFLVAGAGLNIDLLVRVETETEFFVVELVVELGVGRSAGLAMGLGVGLEAVEVAVEVATGVDTSLLHAFSHRVAVMKNRIWYKLRIVMLRRNCSVKFNQGFWQSVS